MYTGLTRAGVRFSLELAVLGFRCTLGVASAKRSVLLRGRGFKERDVPGLVKEVIVVPRKALLVRKF